MKQHTALSYRNIYSGLGASYRFAFDGMKPMENTLYVDSQSKENKPHTQALGIM